MNVLTIEEKQQSVYAALLRFSAEAGELRERTLERIVIAAMLGTSANEPLRLGAIRQNIHDAAGGLDLRVDLVQTTIDRLIRDRKVERTLLRTKAAYYLLSGAEASLTSTIAAGSALFATVTDRLLENTDHLVDRDVGARIIRTFISACFSRFGKQIARAVLGYESLDEAIPVAEARGLYSRSCDGISLSPEALASLEERCLTFTRSRHPDDQKLRFYLTQSYYFAQLLGADGGTFNPLAVETFNGAVFYLDANIIISRLLDDELAQRFDELWKQARRFGIRLVVTRATINEIRKVAADRENQMKVVLDKYPTGFSATVDDAFLSAFLVARQRQPTITVSEFMAKFDHLFEVLQSELGVEVEDIVEEDLLHGDEMETIGIVMQEECVASRGWRKSHDILRHDVAHHALITAARRSNPKAWFLTRDRTVLRAAVRLSPGGQAPFAFSFIGFLQSLSPFLNVNGDGNAALDVFSWAFDQAAAQPSFSLQELQLIAEMHEDVLQTPSEKLATGFDYVKRSVLHGEPYTKEDAGKFAVGLKTHLASSTEEHRATLIAERDRMKHDALAQAAAKETERALRHDVERDRERLAVSVADLEQQLADVARTMREKDEETAASSAAAVRHERKRLAWAAARGVAVASVIWFFRDELGDAVISRVRVPDWLNAVSTAQVVLDLIGFAVFFIPLVRLVRVMHWSAEKSVAALGAMFVAGAWWSNILSDDVWSRLSSYIEVGMFAGVLIYFFLGGIRKESAATAPRQPC